MTCWTRAKIARSLTACPPHRKRQASGALPLLLAAGLLVPCVGAGASPRLPQTPKLARAKQDKPDKLDKEDDEVRLGRENAEQNDKVVKLVTDAAIVERVNRIGQELARAANTSPVPALWGSPEMKQFHYTFKVVDDRDVNAYSLPGGFIYVNKGLLDFCHSDDELAGVLAHEISHAAHHHVMKLLREQKKIQNVMLPLQILAMAALVAGHGNTQEAGNNLLIGSQLYATAKINSYSVDAEKDADHSGLLLMTHSHYNPVGLYSFMLRMVAYENKRIYGDMGILRTHPPAPERVEAAKDLLTELKIPILLSEVDPDIRATVTTEGGPTGEISEIKIRGFVFCRLVAADGMTAEQRAHRIGQRLNALLDQQLQPFEVKVSRDKSRIQVRGVTVIESADATAQNKTLDQICKEMADAVAMINQKEQMDTAQ